MDYSIAFWNLENLFAPEAFPGREPWVAAAMSHVLAGWTPALFEHKVGRLADVIATLDAGRGPDLLGVCEVENAHVMQALAGAMNARLPARRYAVVHVDHTLDRRGIDTAFVYDTARLEAVPGELFSHFVMRRTVVALARGLGVDAEGGVGRPVVEVPHGDDGRVRALGLTHALVPVGQRLAGSGAKAAGERGMAAGARRPVRGHIEHTRSPRLYNLAWNYLRFDAVTVDGRPRTLYGTLYYDGNGNVFDQVLVSRSLLGNSGRLRVREETAGVHAPPAMVHRSKNSGPIRFGLPKGNAERNLDLEGFSDHFPVQVTLSED